MEISVRSTKQADELSRIDKQLNKPKPAFYMAYLLIILTIIYVVDEITSNINSSMQPYILFDLFHISSRDVNSAEYTHALNIVAPLSLFSNALLLIAPFYKAMSDRFGRRVFLMLNTLGMGVGMLIVMSAPNVAVYILGMLFMMFFTPNDMQVLYILETAPKERRATYCFVTKAIALVSVSLIGVFSRMFIRESVPSSWRMVYVIPVAAALIVGATCIFFVRETPAFLMQRKAYLSMSDEERAAKAKADEKAKVSENGGVIQALRYIFHSKQLKWIFISGFIFYSTIVYTSYYTTVMEGAMTTANVAIAMMVYPFFNGITTFVSGILSDILGRKRVCLILGIVTILGLLMFILSCRLGFGPIAAGISYGCSIGGLWSISDTLILTMPAESTPSSMRSSVMGTMNILIGLGMVIGNVIFIICQNFIPKDILFMIICLPFMVISLILLMTKVKETKDVDLDRIDEKTFL